MRQRHMMAGFDMEEEHSHRDTPPMNPVPNPTFKPYDNNGLPQYPPHPYHHQQGGAPSLVPPGMSTPPNLYLPLHAQPSHPLAHVTSTVHESNPHFMGHGYKRKSDEVVIPGGNHQYINEAAPPYSFPHFATAYPQPIDQRSVRSRVGSLTIDPPYSHGHNSFVQGNYVPPPGPVWYDQYCNGNTSNESSSLWLQPPPVPFMNGNAVPRYHEASSSRNDIPFAYPSPHYLRHHLALPPPPPPPTVYPRMASASYTVPMTIHDASYRNVGFRMSLQHPRDDFSSAATLRHHGLPNRRAFPADEDAGFWGGDFYDDLDDHQDMRLDIDDMSYEELLDLSDHIGTVKTGLSEETVKALVKRRTTTSTRINLEEAPSTDPETDSCTICQETYKNKDKIVTLDCKHEYHAECLEKWLVIKNVCPICKSEALVMEQDKA